MPSGPGLAQTAATLTPLRATFVMVGAGVGAGIMAVPLFNQHDTASWFGLGHIADPSPMCAVAGGIAATDRRHCDDDHTCLLRNRAHPP